MSTDDRLRDPLRDEDELLAAELAFGLLDADERGAAEARIDGDAAFAAAYRRWLGYAATMASGRDEAPRPSIWAAIEIRLPANDAAIPVTPATTVRWWQASTFAAVAAAVVLAVIGVERSPLPAPAPVVVQARPAAPLVAVLTGAPDKGVVTVSYDPISGRLTSAPVGIDVRGHSAELWVIPAGQSPRPLGVIAAGAPGWTQAPARAIPVFAVGATLAISVEPVGGSPTGLPTGPVILTGKIVAT
jgi:anti-sigma-K factor RskA